MPGDRVSTSPVAGPIKHLSRFLRANRYHFAAIALAAGCTGLTLAILGKHGFPPGGDGGQWLGMVWALLGKGVSRVDPLAYPPLYFLLLAGIVVLIGDPVVAVFASIAIILFMLYISTYWSFYVATRQPLGGLIACVLIWMAQPFMDMLAWGGYPSLLSLVFFMPTVALLVRSSLADRKKVHLLLLGAFAGLTLLSHPLSAFLLAIAVGSYIVLVQLYRRDLKWLKGLITMALPIAALLYLPYLAMRIAPGGTPLPNYLIEVPVYNLGLLMFPLIPRSLRGVLPFTIPFILLLVGVLCLLALHPLPVALHRKTLPGSVRWIAKPFGRELGVRAYFAFLVTFVPPLLVPVLFWRMGLFTDYSRFSYYLWVPLGFLGGAVLSRFASWRVATAPFRSIQQMISHRRRRSGQTSTARGRGTRVARIAIGTVVMSLAVVVVQMTTLLGLAYLESSRDYYLSFNQAADRQLSDWVRSNTQPDDLLMLSPDWRHENTYRWLEGLSGRRSIGYSQPRYLFYERELQVNHDIYQMFHHRVAINGGTFEVSTRGVVGGQNYSYEFAVIDRRAPFPIAKMFEVETAVLSPAHATFMDQFPLKNGWTRTEPDGRALLIHLSLNDYSPMLLERRGSVGEKSAELLFQTESPMAPVIGYQSMLVPSGAYCSIKSSIDSVSWFVRTDRQTCVEVKITGEPHFRPQWRGDVLAFTIGAQPDGSARLIFSSEAAIPGLPPVQSVSDSLTLFAKYGVDYVILRSENLEWLALLGNGYGFPRVFQNSRYVVLKAESAALPEDGQVADFLSAAQIPGRSVLLGPGLERSPLASLIERRTGMSALVPGDHLPVVPRTVRDDLAYEMLTHRLTIASNAVLVGTLGDPGPEGGLRVSVLRKGTAYPVFEILDRRSKVVMDNGSEYNLADLGTGTAESQSPQGVPKIAYHQPAGPSPIGLVREVSGTDQGVSTSWSVAGGDVWSFAFAIVPIGPRCTIPQAGWVSTWSAWVAGECISLRLAGSTALEAFVDQDVVIAILYPDAAQNAEVTFELEERIAGWESGPQGRDLGEVYSTLDVRHVVLSKEDLGPEEGLLNSWFGFERVFESEEYVILARK